MRWMMMGVMVLVVEMMLMTILMMPGVMAMTMATISPSGREFPDRFLPAGELFSLSGFRLAEAAEK